MKVLMLVATSVATDTRVLREATTLVGAGHEVHIIGRSVPTGWSPPEGVTVSSVGTSSVFRSEGTPSLTGKTLPPHVAFARWMLLPQHRASAFGRWAAGAMADAQAREFDVVHAHDFTALGAGRQLSLRRGVPLVYDTHELWLGRPREHRPAPVQDALQRRQESQWGAAAAAVITVGDGVADELRRRYGWSHVTVVRNTFEISDAQLASAAPALPAPRGLVYAGRLAAFRELEVIAAASERLSLPVTLMGPADSTWLSRFDPRRVTVREPCAPDDVDAVLREAGAVLVTHSNAWLNHRLALPNKLFHAVRAGVPVIATDVQELAAMVRQYHLGTLYTPGDPASLVGAVHHLVAHYSTHVQAVREAAHHLRWQFDAERLVGVYEKLC